MRELEEIRNNLLRASAAQREIYPYPSATLKQELEDAWTRYYHLAKTIDSQTSRPGKKDQLGIIGLIALGVAGVAALFGGTWLIAREFNESQRLAALNECIAKATKGGMTLQEAQQRCNELYGKTSAPIIGSGGSVLDLGLGGVNTTLVLVGGLGLLGVILAMKYL